MLTRRTFLTTSSAALAAGVFGRYDLFAQGGAQAASQALKEIRRNVGIWTGKGGTIGWLINPTGVIAIDSQFPDTAKECVDDLLRKSSKTEIAALINTHHHGDHTGGNGVFRPKTKQIIAHENVPKYLKAGYDQAMQRRASQATPPPVEPTLPDRTFTDTMAFDHGDERVSMKHYGPAHTGGDIVIRFERANVAHMGDLMFNRMQPFIDRANGASIANWVKVLNTVAAELPADTIYIFGHAGPKFEVTGSKADLTHFGNYLTALLEHTRAEVKAGKTREQFVASTDVVKGFEDFGPLVGRVTQAAYDEVASK